MTIRIRFKPAEREAFVVGAEIEWLDVTRWRSGVVTGEIRWDLGLAGSRGGYQKLPIRDTGPTTRTITTGREYAINAGHVRLAIPAAVE